ncbi:N-acetyl sugar amidotransferase [Sulfurovum sp. bin170]|uniref:N-acetyl sugar amidotransferase n=1 Tax=Sulfurovum sp. bin170 TaxID=2695268 RepID=UPI0013E0CA55|nr:N-acetyl sugar amidotransferase [Sulfurovum sp. bin170]NEW60732.1 N-acetyl sugar amidotransferase [Sulfurovum sp. bin170]
MSTYFTDENLWKEEWKRRVQRKKGLKRCSRCLYDEETPNISFNGEGICNYCEKDDELRTQFPGGESGREAFEKIVDDIKEHGKNKKYDVIIGVSGGTDSTYMLHIAKEYGLRPLAVHFDNTWNTTVAQQNIKNALKVLDIDLWTYVVNNNEYDDIYRAFFNASTPDLEIPTDIALAAVLNMAADKFGIKYVFEGHSFKTEGMAPLGWIYMDAKYIDDVHSQFGKLPMKTYPNFRFTKQLKWMMFNQIKKIRPLWYLDYDKSEAKKLITEKYGWQWYGGHHLENRITAFYHTYYLPRKFDIDMRTLGFSGRVRSGQMSREEGLRRMEEIPAFDSELFEMILKRYGYSLEEFEKLMLLPKKTYKEYKTYKPMFEKLRPFFYLMAKAELIPWSFYIKYTAKDNI